MIESKMRGNSVFYDGTNWRYSIDKSLADDSKPCAHCRQMPTVEGYDACLGKLDGVNSACCGHGNPDDMYIMIKEGQDELL